MKRLLLFLGLICITTTSSGDVFDQIGAMDGSDIGAQTSISQDFESLYDVLDQIACENVTITFSTTISSIELILIGWNGFIDPSSITNYQINFYSTPEMVGNSIIGDVLSIDVDPEDATIIGEWTGVGHLISLPVDVTLEQGDHYFGILAANQYLVYGQVGIRQTLIGDGQNGFWGNPGEGWGAGSWGMLPYELAYRFTTFEEPDPCTEPLAPCATDLDGDGVIAVGDVLTIIGNWGQCGDGTYRPIGDITPLPLGDCCVDVSDLLTIIAQWGAVYDCTPIGACCFESGTCTDDMRQPECESQGGLFRGDGSFCSFEDCGLGACCLSETECIENVTAWQCESDGGEFKGSDTICQNVACMLEGDECSSAIEVFAGSNQFDTTLMTPSSPEPSELGNDNGTSWNCFSDYFDWNNSRDGWYKYMPLENGYTTFSTCDIDSFDTSIALYGGGCDPPNQVGCNGDSATGGSNCQAGFSSIDYFVMAGSVYYIRIGSWNGESVGIGTLTITPPPSGDGACCRNNSCFENENSVLCLLTGGEFMGDGVLCEDVNCEEPTPPSNDFCSTAEEIFIGQTIFDTTLALAGNLQVDETQCPSSSLNWCYQEGANWVCTPDVWFYYVAPASERVRFTTCDATSYDTSIVLYENVCNDTAAQVACNGDGIGENGCQPYYSSIEYDLIQDQTYFLRVGGWKGDTGAGTLTLTPVGTNEIAACCVLGNCIGDTTEADCQAQDGEWNINEYCFSFVCEPPLCPNAILSQSPYAFDDLNWSARISAYDPSNSQFYEAAANVQANAMNRFTVWGIEAINLGGWNTCAGVNSFQVRTYSDDGSGLPGTIVTEYLSTTPTRTPTGIFYNAGGSDFELYSYEFDVTSTAFDHISVQSNSDGLHCWFLWMGSPYGDGNSSFNAGSGWSFVEPDYATDLSICIE